MKPIVAAFLACVVISVAIAAVPDHKHKHHAKSHHKKHAGQKRDAEVSTVDPVSDDNQDGNTAGATLSPCNCSCIVPPRPSGTGNPIENPNNNNDDNGDDNSQGDGSNGDKKRHGHKKHGHKKHANKKHH